MDLKEIQELIKFVSKTNISGLKIKRGDFEIKIVNQKIEEKIVPVAMPQMQQMAVPQTQQVAVAPPAQAASAEPATAAQSCSEETVDSSKTFVFKSPMIGTFYRKPAPDKEMFVKVGDTVKNGDVLCVIEAMKLFNEIEFDAGGGRIIKVLAEDSSPVEYDQPLFLIEKVS